MRLVCGMGLYVAGQRLLVLELDATLGAGVGVRVVAVMELLMHRQVILSGESLGAVCAGELVVLLVGALVPPQTVTPLECLSTQTAHVLALACVTVHVTGQMLLHSSCVFTKRAAQLCRSSLALPAPLLLWRVLRVGRAALLWWGGEGGGGGGGGVVGGGRGLLQEGLEGGRAGGEGVL